MLLLASPPEPSAALSPSSHRLRLDRSRYKFPRSPPRPHHVSLLVHFFLLLGLHAGGGCCSHAGLNHLEFFQVIDKFVDPLVGHLKSILSHRKFRMGLQIEVDEMLRAKKAENPMRIAYSFGISHEHPGTFILSYIRGTDPHHEYIGLYPNGFLFRKRDFDNIDRLLSYFQKNIDKPPPDAGPSIQNVAPMVPMKNSACGSGGGAGDANDGWRRDGNYKKGRPLSGTGRSGGRFNSRNNSGGDGQGHGHGRCNYGNDDNGGGGNSGGLTSNMHRSQGRLGTGGNRGSSWGGVGTGGGSGGRNAA